MPVSWLLSSAWYDRKDSCFTMYLGKSKISLHDSFVDLNALKEPRCCHKLYTNDAAIT